MKQELWYREPAGDWNEALPIGNGALGAMIFGGIYNERVQFSEESLWYGGYRARHNEDAAKNLPKVRTLLSAGKIREAEKLLGMSMFAVPQHERHYSVLGDFCVDFYHDRVKDCEAYKRTLDLEAGVSTVSYQIGETTYERKYFCSYPDQVFVGHFKASQKGALELSVYIDRDVYVEEVSFDQEKMRTGLSGQSGPDGVKYDYELQVEIAGGSVELIGQRIYVKDCDEVLIKITGATNFKYEDAKREVTKRLDSLEGKKVETLYRRHVEDYQRLMGRVKLDLMGEDLSKLPTDQRLERMRQGEEDKDLIALYFQYGRYLMVSSSRPGGLPSNLQGIWNGQWQPPWGSKYTININTEMNYWPAEKCQLSECHLPLFEHMERMKPHGEKTAQKMYHCGGWVAHHNTDIWGDTAPQDMWMPGTIWPMGAAWLSLHIWEHYEYTNDLNFLKEKYHLLKGAGDFFKDYLIKDEKGYLVTSPSVSPENTYVLPSGESGTVCIGPTMDNEILHELFSAIIKSGQLLGEKPEEIQKYKELCSQLTPLQIGKYGQIMEWREDYEELEPGHRHISQLFGLYPGHQITMSGTPELAKAAKVTLERRLSYGGGHTGWSRAWIINLWARLKEGELAYENVKELLKKSTMINLLDNHPPFQIDGNFGGTAGIGEMLMQEEEGYIELLPAIPKTWDKGTVQGLCAKGGLILNFTWEQGKIKELILFSTQRGHYALKMNGPLSGIQILTASIKEENQWLLELDLEENHAYVFKSENQGEMSKF